MKRSSAVSLGLVAALAVGAAACDDSTPRYADQNAAHCVDPRTDQIVPEAYCSSQYVAAHHSPFIFYYGGYINGPSYYGSRITGYSRTRVVGRSYVYGSRSFSTFRSNASRSAARSGSSYGSSSRASVSRGGFGRSFGGFGG